MRRVNGMQAWTTPGTWAGGAERRDNPSTQLDRDPVAVCNGMKPGAGDVGQMR